MNIEDRLSALAAGDNQFKRPIEFTKNDAASALRLLTPTMLIRLCDVVSVARVCAHAYGPIAAALRALDEGDKQ